jgi:hypothetical protein
MKISPQAASAPVAPLPKTNEHNALNPAKQAKAADPAVKGAAFGHLVASFAHAKHAPPTVLTPPITEPPVTDETAPVEDAPPAETTVPPATVVEETTATEPVAQTVAPPVSALIGDIETQLLADLITESEPGDSIDINA